MKKFGLLMIPLLLAACFDKAEEQQDSSQQSLEGFKLGIVVSSDIPHVYFDRASNGAAREFMSLHPEMQITFKNADDNFETQKAQIKEELDRGVQALFLHIGGMNPNQTAEIVSMICNAKVPAVYHNVSPRDEILSSCPIAYFVGSDNVDIGVNQGLAVVNKWRENPDWDKNGDGIIQFAQVCLAERWGPGLERNGWAHSTIRNYPKLSIEAEQILSGYPGFQYDVNSFRKIVSEWEADERFGELEVILSCADGLSDALIQALNEKSLKFPIFSMEGSEWAREAVRKGDLVHTTVFQLREEVLTGINLVLNLAHNRPPETNISFLIKDKKVRVGAGD